MGRKNDILYNILDQYTGEPVTYRKVTTYADGTPMDDAKCDGVIYRKKDAEYFKREFTGPLNARWFGAKGDGITDNAAPLLAAINAANGQPIYVPKGDYKILSPIVLNKPLTLRGESGAVLFGAGATLPSLFDVNTDRVDINNITISTCLFAFYCTRTKAIASIKATNSTFTNIDRVFYFESNAKVQNLSMQGNTFDGLTHSAIFFYQAKNAFITNNVFRNILGTGAAVAVWIAENTVDGQMFNEKIIVQGNIFRDIQGGSNEIKGVLVEGIGVSVIGNHFENILNGYGEVLSTECEAIYLKAINGVVQGNTLIEAGDYEGAIVCKGVPLSSGDNTARTDSLVITGNVIEKKTAKKGSSFNSIRTLGNNVVVSNNILRGVHATIVVGSSPKNPIIAGNILDAEDAGIALLGSFDGKVKDNFIRSTGLPSYGAGIDIRNGINTLVESNVIEVPTANSEYHVGVRIMSNSSVPGTSATKIYVRGNVIKASYHAFRLWAFDTYSVNDVRLEGNVIQTATIPYLETKGGTGAVTSIVKLSNSGLDNRSSVIPFSSPKQGDSYLDDGTNTLNKAPGMRYYTGSTWIDLSVKAAATQSNSTATDVAGVVTDFNALLAKLKSAGLMA